MAVLEQIENPLRILYAGLWDLLLNDDAFASTFKPGNRVKMTESEPDEKDARLAADYPEIGLFPSTSDSPPRVATTDSRFWTHLIAVRLRSGKPSVETLLDAQWIVYRVIFEALLTLPDQIKWPNGDDLLIRASLLPAKIDLDRGSDGWVGLMSIEAVLGLERGDT